MRFLNKTLALAAVTIFLAAAASTVSAQRVMRQASETGGVTWDKGIIAANESATLTQCANDPAPSPSTDGCTAGTDWDTGNLGASKSFYREGDSIAYRVVMGNLTQGSTGNTITIEWDTTKGGKHAIDYLTSFDQTVATAVPCAGVAGCNPAVFDTEPIPVDPLVTAGGVTPIGGVFTLYGGTITGVSAYTMAGSYAGDSSTRITITFTADAATAVLAWGGHIATRHDWGFNNSAVNISGSPYHTRLIELNGSGGNQDRSLSADAVFFTAYINIIKTVNTFLGGTASEQIFNFTATGLTPNAFSLVDDDGGTGVDTQTYTFDTAAPSGTVTVTESLTTGWSLANLTCVFDESGGATGGSATPNFGTRTVSIVLLEGNIATCTFNNQQTRPTAAAASISGRVSTQSGNGIRGAIVTVYDATTGASMSAITNSFGYYMFTGLQVEDLYVINVRSKSYTFSNGQWSGVLGGDLTDLNFTSDQ